MGENQATDAAVAVATGAGDQGDSTAPPRRNGIQYCSEHRPANAAAAAAVADGGICAVCLQEKLKRLVSSSNSSLLFPRLPSSPASFRHAAEPPALPLPFHPSGGASRKFMSFHRKNAPASSSSSTAASAGGGGLKRSKSVAPRRELEQFPCSSAAAALANESPRKKSFWSFLSLTSFTAYAHPAVTAAARLHAVRHQRGCREEEVAVRGVGGVGVRGTGDGAQGQQPRGGTLEDISEPESPIQSRVSPSGVGRKVGRSRSVGCGRRSFSGEFQSRRHRSWAWALAWPMRALRPTTTSTSTKTITVVPPVTIHGNSSASSLSIPSPTAPSAEAAPVAAS